ncbi:thiamine phosphate synthase [Companilactobacillus sp. DQM5]|uniref:thiamine phosphate synthase n=1 Tax=Companilactobacillus sp. DQM5 TaxID=3463359 RepID=UPI0040593816
MKFTANSLNLYAVTDRTWLNGRTLGQCVEQAIIGGATIIQLREKKLKIEEFVNLAKQIKEICQKYNVPFLIDDNLDVAKLVDADGIHIGQNDISLLDAKKGWGNNDKIFGVSVQTAEQAKKAQIQGADYLGVGAIFPTDTKNDASEVSIEELKEIVQTVNIPVCAIGGIHKNNISRLYSTGIDGIALVSEIFNSENIIENTKSIAELVKPFGSEDR